MKKYIVHTDIPAEYANQKVVKAGTILTKTNQYELIDNDGEWICDPDSETCKVYITISEVDQ